MTGGHQRFDGAITPVGDRDLYDGRRRERMPDASRDRVRSLDSRQAALKSIRRDYYFQ